MGLYHYRNRYFVSMNHRFLSEDPTRFMDGINLYAYVKNDPIYWTDPLGLAKFCKRPLKNTPWLGPASSNPIDDKSNTEISHEQIWFDDNPKENIGFFYDDDGIVRADKGFTRADYVVCGEFYDDDLIRKAIKNVDEQDYSLFGFGPKNKFNCQDWTDVVREEYRKLQKKSK